MAGFADEVAASLAPRLSLPKEFRILLEWLDANGYVRQARRTGQRFAGLYPADLADEGTSIVTFVILDADYVRGWTRGNAEGANRLSPIIRTGGDGSHAALWLDDDGTQKFVHLGSGSGSTMLCTLTQNPIDMLRLVAIGYSELCWPDHFDLTPEEASAEADGDTYVPPIAFRNFVETSFDVKIPETASAIVSRTASMLDAPSEDPFWKWITGFDS